MLASHIADLITKEAGVKAETLGAAADRDAAKKAVSDDLNRERAYVEELVNADPANAAIIAHDAAMTLRTQAPRSKPLLAIKRGVVSGTVQAVAKAAKGASAASNNSSSYPTSRRLLGRAPFNHVALHRFTPNQ